MLVLVRTADHTDPTPYELRLRSELAAEGIVSVVVNPMSTPNETKQVAAKFDASAVVEVAVSASEITTSIWASDPSLNLEVTRNLRVSAKERDAVGVFALRTVDFLQGARIELEQQRQAKLAPNTVPPGTTGRAEAEQPAGTPVPPPFAQEKPKTETKQTPVLTPLARKPAQPAKASAPAPAKALRSSSPVQTPTPLWGRKHVRLAASYTFLRTSDVFRWATAPSLALAWYFTPRMAVGVFGAGPYINHVNARSDQYSISVDQEYLGLDSRIRFEIAGPVDIEPYLALGMARYSVDATVEASASKGLVGHHANVWSLFSVGGATLAWRVGGHFRLLADVGALVKWQVPRIEAVGLAVADGSAWNFVAKAGTGWAF